VREEKQMETEYAIQVTEINKAFKDFQVLKNVNLAVKPGEICGIVGRNGSGKTVLFKCICQIFIPDSGKISIMGHDIAKHPQVIKELGIIIENPAFLENFSGYWNLKFLADLTHRIGKEQIMETIQKVSLENASNKKVKNYSLGMKQRLAIAQAIMEKQKILILDEPMNGLDKKGVAEIRELLLDLRKRGHCILIASHNPQDMEILCDHVYEMDDGVLAQIS
jgi:ABC-2 type transport system ATP-binding protein